MWPTNTICGGEIIFGYSSYTSHALRIQQIKCYDLIGGGSCTNTIELIHKLWQ